ncbi:MAG: sensor histidine kinase [Bacteroidota bacterium]
MVGIGRDIRKQKETEQKLIEQTQKLQEVNTLLKERQEEIQQQSEELKAQTDSLQEINSQLERLNKTKNKFFSIIAHDLKNPFHAILGFTDLLIDNVEDFDVSKNIELLQLIRSTTSNAYNLLENLLNWARTQTDSIKYSPDHHNLKSLIQENIAHVGGIALNKNISLTTDMNNECTAFFDRDMINTVIRNLLNNAIKYTPKGGEVTIRCKSLDSLKYKISVSDNGIGIKPENQKKLFRIDQYYSTSGTEGESGTGLGLIISKEFMNKNNGTLTVSSNPGEGTTFSITLPKDYIGY